MTEVEIAWLAGFLEGEASFTCVRKKASLTLQLTLQTTDEDVAVKAANLMGTKACGPYYRKIGVRPARKPYWAVRVSGESAASVMNLVRPHMGQRRCDQIDHAIAMWGNRRSVNREIGGPPTCHPDKPHYSRGLCRGCHYKLFVHDRRKGVVEIPALRPMVA